MGKWCLVKCSCLSRRPIPGSGFVSYDDYVKFVARPRLAKTQNEWAIKVRNMYECGHSNGAYLELWPGDIINLGYALELAFKHEPEKFEQFRRIANFKCYDDEYLVLDQAASQQWCLEIEELRKFVSDEIFLGWHQKAVFERKLADTQFLYGDMDGTLSDASALCNASSVTSQPIEFLW